MKVKKTKPEPNLTIDRGTLENVSAKQKSLVEIESLTLQLSNWDRTRPRIEALGEDESKRYLEISRRRENLIKANPPLLRPDITLNPPFGFTEKPEVNVRLLNLQPEVVKWLFPWQQLATPFMVEGVSATPNLPLTSGEIATIDLSLGGCAYNGSLTNSQPSSDVRWWIRNWNCTIPFLPAKVNGTISYRFVVDTTCNVYQSTALSGAIASFVTVGTSNNIVQKPIANWRDAGWPINKQLPLSTFPSFNGSVKVDGTIRVRRNQRAAIGLIVGMVVGVSQGGVIFSWGNFYTRRRVFNSVVRHTDFGMIEYQFAADPLMLATERLHSMKLDIGNP